MPKTTTLLVEYRCLGIEPSGMHMPMEQTNSRQGHWSRRSVDHCPKMSVPRTTPVVRSEVIRMAPTFAVNVSETTHVDRSPVKV